MHAVAEVRVQVPGFAEHHRVAGGATAECVRSRILADAAIRLELGEPDRDRARREHRSQHRTEQERCERDRILLEERPVGRDEAGSARPLGKARHEVAHAVGEAGELLGDPHGSRAADAVAARDRTRRR